MAGKVCLGKCARLLLLARIGCRYANGICVGGSCWGWQGKPSLGEAWCE